VVLDILEKNNPILPGDYGYVRSQRKKNLTITLILLCVCFSLFLLGKVVFYRAEIMFSIASIFVLLPAAQFFARFFSFRRYNSLKKEQFEQISTISEHFWVLGELPIIRGKKEYLLLALVITDIGLFGLIERQKNKTIAQRNCRSMEAIITDILKPRGITTPIDVVDDFETFEHSLRTQIKSKVQNNDDQQVRQKIKEAIMMSVH